MPKHTIELGEKEIQVINTIKSVQNIKSIDKAIAFIVQEYGKTEGYIRFIEEKRKK